MQVVSRLVDSSGASVSPGEGGTLIVSGGFWDADGTPVAPTSASWTLTDASGDTINGRAGVAIPPASTYAIVLTGADLPGGRRGLRLLIHWTYDSLVSGAPVAGLTGVAVFVFSVTPLTKSI